MQYSFYFDLAHTGSSIPVNILCELTPEYFNSIYKAINNDDLNISYRRRKFGKNLITGNCISSIVNSRHT